MKKVTVLVVTLLMIASAAQAQGIEKLLDRYSTDERFSYTSVGSGLIQFGLNFIYNKLKDIDIDNVVKDELSKLTGLKILTLESKTEAEKKMITSITDELTNVIKKDTKAELILETRDKKDITKIYTTSEGLLIVSTEPEEISIVCFFGKLTKKLIQTIVSDKNKN
jgi:hypothetical protein